MLALAGLGTLTATASADSASSVHSAPTTVLTLEEVLSRILPGNPDLTAADEELRARDAEYRQAGRLPNPELAITLENVAGDGTYQDSDAAEFTVELSQPIELGGKRRLRREAAELDRQLAANQQLQARTEVLATTRQRYVGVLAAQEGLALAREQMELAEKSLAAAEERFKAGKAPHVDRLRLHGEYRMVRLALTQAERTLATARQTLSACWNAATLDFDLVTGELARLPDLPALSEIEAALEQTPEATSRRVATTLSSVALEQARAGRIPDPSLTIGWRQFRESDEQALTFGIAIPLPLFDQGQDAVAAAGSRLNSTQAREVGARREALIQLRAAWQTLADARSEAEVLGSQVVPAAAEGFAATEFGYQAGKFGLIELLDAQRALFQIRQRQLAAQTASQLAAIELQRLLGGAPMTAFQPSPL